MTRETHVYLAWFGVVVLLITAEVERRSFRRHGPRVGGDLVAALTTYACVIVAVVWIVVTS